MLHKRIKGKVEYTFPQDNYRVFVVYETTADGGTLDYINMINGKNRIKAIVTTTLDRDQNNYTEPYIILNHDISEGTGMYGEVVLYYNLYEQKGIFVNE